MKPMTSTERLLAHMSPEVAATFTPMQRQALQMAFQSRRHVIDIRLSIPCIWTRFYLVVLAGKERRSVYRRRLEADKHPVWTMFNAIAIACVISILGLGLVYSVKMGVGYSSSLLNRKPAPTAVPFKADQESCEKSGRVWSDEVCWDYEHSTTF